ncbi:hypothetical protein LSCM1_02475 [Leishmania martiniquensis]|uniref:Uncharacterized protein n=1 Tax=Leishmania martiniquensis TaxID=1580590 RepID=A0A836GPA8_9TRYP|nr:hypothetical protein LSCM1_02475 [Leishmania martiniquensis]
MHSYSDLLCARPQLLLGDTLTPFTDAHVVHQLVDFAYSLGLVSPLWMSYDLSLMKRLTLCRGTVPVNVWHAMCGRSFFLAHPSHLCYNIDRSKLRKASPESAHPFTLKACRLQLTWEPTCPSVALCFQSGQPVRSSHQLWVPDELVKQVPVHPHLSATIPPFLTFVHVEQLHPTKHLSAFLQRLRRTHLST